VTTDPDASWYTNHIAAPAEATDEELVAAALNADRAAFRKLVKRHQRGLVNHLYRHIGHRESALDLAQEVFLKIYLSLSTFDPKYRFTTWLYRIASNCAIDYLRKKRPLTYSLTTNPNDSYPARTAKAIAGHEPDPVEMLRYQELQGRLELAVQNLPADYRQLILLRHRQHCRYDEIARITKLPIGTVKNRIFRAREILKRELADILEREEQHGEL
jgi:RNA polymerase sigma-70 factor (ECF subfamily)